MGSGRAAATAAPRRGANKARSMSQAFSFNILTFTCLPHDANERTHTRANSISPENNVPTWTGGVYPNRAQKRKTMASVFTLCVVRFGSARGMKMYKVSQRYIMGTERWLSRIFDWIRRSLGPPCETTVTARRSPAASTPPSGHYVIHVELKVPPHTEATG